MRFLVLIGGAISGSSLLACAVPDQEIGPGQESVSSTATAIVVVERTSGPGDAARGDAVVARFVRVRQGTVDDPALRIAGVGTDIPTPGSCFVPPDDAPVIQHGRSVELLDVGQVVLSTENATKSTVLVPRSMPDPAGVVSGMFYSMHSADAFAAGSRLSLRSSGGADLLDGFSISVTAPREVTDVAVGSTSGGLDVSWESSDLEASDPRVRSIPDLVYVDVLSPATHVAMRCTGANAGHLLVPQSTIAGIEEGLLAVHRLHKESFRAKGIEPGEVRFDVAKIVPFRR